jgi:hypothetical protein
VSESPLLTVLLVTGGRGALLRRTLQFLGAQTIRDRIQLILIAPSETSFNDLDESLLKGFAECRILGIGPIVEVERAFAPGIMAATAPIVALLENHVYPAPEWGEAIVRAFEGPWLAVGSIITNANGGTSTSWVEHFLTYGLHDETAPHGEVSRIARNNSAFRRDVLSGFGEALPDVLARDGGLLESLRANGGRFYRAGDARMAHLNPSRLRSMLRLRVQSARASSATRARTSHWSPARRIVYAIASPVFPALRLRVLWPRMKAHPARPALPRLMPTLGVALMLDAVGQALGFSSGAGSSAERAGIYDLDREPHITAADRARFMP